MENGHTLNTRTGAGNMKNERKPILLVIAGPNGSGKSTITGWFDIVGEYTNADEMVAATGMSNLDAAVLADQRRYAAIERHADLTFETVLSSEYKLEIVRKAKAEGYFIKGVFVLTTDPKINKSRVKSRVADGGHDVDESKITARYYKSLGNVPELLSLCDILHIYDNSGALPFRIVRKHKESLSIFPCSYWSEERILALIGI